MLKLTRVVCVLMGTCSITMASNDPNDLNIGANAQNIVPRYVNTVTIPMGDPIIEIVPAQPTTQIKLHAGLPSMDVMGVTHTQKTTIYGPDLNAYDLTISYRYEDMAMKRWRVQAHAMKAQDHMYVPVDPTWMNGVPVTFNGNNLLDQINHAIPLPPLSIMPVMVAPFDIAVDLGTPGQSNGLKIVPSNLFENNTIEQNGRGQGETITKPAREIIIKQEVYFS